jgi:hypothetical protein
MRQTWTRCSGSRENSRHFRNVQTSPRESLKPTPNLSLNADVPHAGLRPGMRPPVSLFR